MVVVAVSGVQAQPTLEIETLVARLGAYLADYEQQLGTVIAHERYRQSEVAFLRLPGNALVPHELREDFETAGGGRFQGRATYSNFRRFTTSARILPPGA